MNAQEKKLMDKIWQYPLYKALAERRAHRFGLGYEFQEIPFPYKSERKPVPLSELETALLCWAGHGINGLILGEVPASFNNFMSWLGRTHPDACNCQHGELIFINDNGTFLYRPSEASKVMEIETEEEREKTLDMFRKSTVKIADSRPDLPPASVLKLNAWHINRPGQTLFMPMVDVTPEYINFLLITFGDERNQIMDERTGKPAGLKKWIDNGYLNGPSLTLTLLELFVFNVVIGTAHYMAQNILLGATAMGLGCFPWSGFTPLIVMGGTPLTKGLGFRFITGKDGMPNPVGKDGYIETLCPPYVKNMDEAVDKVVDMKFGQCGLFTAGCTSKVSWRDPSLPTKAPRFSKETVDCVKDFCNYVYNTYGRFPAVIDTIQMPVAATVHHLDLDFYDKFYPPTALTKEHREHMKVWHEG